VGRHLAAGPSALFKRAHLAEQKRMLRKGGGNHRISKGEISSIDRAKKSGDLYKLTSPEKSAGERWGKEIIKGGRRKMPPSTPKRRILGAGGRELGEKGRTPLRFQRLLET